jgi:hypothetical protein
MLHLVVEVENAVRHDFSILETVTGRRRRRGHDDASEARLLLEAHERFLTIYLPSLFGRPLDELWSATVAPRRAAGRCRAPATRSRSRARSRCQRGACRSARALERGDLEHVAAVRHKFENGDREFLAALKGTISQGVSAFERHGQDTVERAGGELLAATTAIPSLRRALGRVAV